MEEMRPIENVENKPSFFSFFIPSLIGIVGFLLVFLIFKLGVIKTSSFFLVILTAGFSSFIIGLITMLISKNQILKKSLISIAIFSVILIVIFLIFGGDMTQEGVLFFKIWSVLILPYILGAALASGFYKFSRNWKIISSFIISLIFLYLILFGFLKVGLSVHLEITPKKESYKLGETITTSTTITNYSLIPFGNMFSMGDTSPDITIKEVKQPLQGFVAPAMVTRVSIAPFQSETYEIDLTLVNNAASVDQWGSSSYNHDIVVKPGKNTVISEWVNSDEAIINIEDNGFDKEEMDCEDFESETRKGSCYSELALFNDDTDHCDKIKGYSQGDCYTKKAIKEKDFSYCDEIVDDLGKLSCLSEKAKFTKDFSICPQLKYFSGLYNSCIKEEAKNTNDLSVCEKIEDQLGKTDCEDSIVIDQNLYVNKFFKYYFNYPKDLKILQEASSDDQNETMMIEEDNAGGLTILIAMHDNTEKLTAEQWAKKEYGGNEENKVNSHFEIKDVSGQPIFVYLLSGEKGRDLGKSISVTKKDFPYVIEFVVLGDDLGQKNMKTFKTIIESFGLEGF